VPAVRLDCPDGCGCGGRGVYAAEGWLRRAVCRGEEIQSASIHGASSFLYTVGYQQGRINYFLAHSELVPSRGMAGMRRSIMQRGTGGQSMQFLRRRLMGAES